MQTVTIEDVRDEIGKAVEFALEAAPAGVVAEMLRAKADEIAARARPAPRPRERREDAPETISEAIVRVLAEAGRPMTTRQIVRALPGRNQMSIATTVSKLGRFGTIRVLEPGTQNTRYAAAEVAA